jgi:AcrR family transcriptional regulator
MALEPVSQIADSARDRHRGGRRLDNSRDDELRQATLSLLAEIGYERLTMDAIAANAGAGKATLYRRWSGKAELVLDAIVCAKNRVTLPDTGSLYGDLIALFNQGAEIDSEFDAHVMVGLVNAMARDDELRAAFQEQMIAPLLSVLVAIFHAAVERGEIAPVKNLDLVVSIVPAYLLYRHIIFGDGFDTTTFVSIVDDVLLPLVQFTSPASVRRKHPAK